MGKADFLAEYALKAWPLLKEEVADLVKSVLHELAHEEAKTRLRAAVKAGAEGLKGLLEAEAPPSTPAWPAEVVDRELLQGPSLNIILYRRKIKQVTKKTHSSIHGD